MRRLVLGLVVISMLSACAPRPELPTATPTLADDPRVHQCQTLFAQSLGGIPVRYPTPAMTTLGKGAFVRLSAVRTDHPDALPIAWVCQFNGTALLTAERD